MITHLCKRGSAHLFVLFVLAVLPTSNLAYAEPPHAECPEESVWSPMISGTSEWLWGVWGYSTNDVIAVGNLGTIVRFVGSNTWIPMESSSLQDLCDVWGTGMNDVFAVGIAGTILHFDGDEWSLMSSVTSEDLYAVWGSGPGDVFAVGISGTIVHYDGSVWSEMTSATTLNLFSVDAETADNACAVGVAGVMTRFDGTMWNSSFIEGADNLSGIWGASVTDLFAVGDGGVIFHYDGVSWNAMDSSTPEALFGVWGSAGDNVFATGDEGTIVMYDGDAWSPMTSDTAKKLFDVWGSSDCDVFAVGEGGTILRYGVPGPVPVFITSFDARPTEVGVNLSWDILADEGIDGFKIYRREGSADELLVNRELLAASQRQFVDADVIPGVTYYYTLTVVETDHGETRSAPVMGKTRLAPVSLWQNHPNPFNPTTTIRFRLPQDARVTLTIFDARGKRVATLVDDIMAADTHEELWDGRDGAGERVGSGIYFYRLQVGETVLTKKMVLLK